MRAALFAVMTSGCHRTVSVVSPVQYIVIPSWEKFQHYKKPKPKWVKLYRDLLGHYEIMQLTPTERWILVGLWCLAAETDNQIPADLKYLTHRLCAEVTVESLRKLQTQGLLQLPATIQEKSRDDLALVEERRESRVEERNANHLPNSYRLRSFLNTGHSDVVRSLGACWDEADTETHESNHSPMQ